MPTIDSWSAWTSIKPGEVYLEQVRKKNQVIETRPVLLVSVNGESDAIVAVKIISSKSKRQNHIIFELNETFLNVPSYVDIQSVYISSRRRFTNKLGELRNDTFEEIRDLITSITEDSFNKIDLQIKADQILEKEIGETASSILKKEFQKPIPSRYNIFLSHSHVDEKEILALKQNMESMGFSVYIDRIEDPHLKPNEVNRFTAEVLRQRMRNCDCMIYAISTNSRKSRWMPWELGFFDAINGKIAILPIQNSLRKKNFSGEEYLSLYNYVTKSKEVLLTSDEFGNQVEFRDWLTDSRWGMDKEKVLAKW